MGNETLFIQLASISAWTPGYPLVKRGSVLQGASSSIPRALREGV